MTRTLLLSLLIAAPLTTGATTYYVDNSSPRASDANAGTSADLPLLTVRKAVTLPLTAGDVVAIRAGTRYSGGVVLTKSGSARAMLTFTSYGAGARAEISNTGGYSDAFLLAGARYVLIDNLRFTGANQAGVYVDKNSGDSVVQNSEFTTVGIGIKVAGQFNTFTKNSFHDLAMVKNTPKSFNADDDYGGNSFVISGSNNEFSYNTALNCKAVSYDYGYDGGMFEFYGDVANLDIHHNYDENDAGFLETGAGLMNNIRVHHNVAVNNDGAFATIHLSGAFAGAAKDVRIENNTVVDTTSVKAGALNYIDATTDPAQVIVRNNIFVVNQIGSIWKNPIPRANNIYLFQSKQTHMMNNWSEAMGPNELRADPQFVNLAGRDFHLKATSPAIGAGVDVGYARDFDARAIPAGRPAIGAYEYVASTAPPTLPLATIPGAVGAAANWKFSVNDAYGKTLRPMALDAAGRLFATTADAGSYARSSYVGVAGTYALDFWGSCEGGSDGAVTLKMDAGAASKFSLNGSSAAAWQRAPTSYALTTGFHVVNVVGLGDCARVGAIRFVKLN